MWRWTEMTEPLGCLDGPGTAALRCVLSGFTVAQRRENRVLFAAAERELDALEAAGVPEHAAYVFALDERNEARAERDALSAVIDKLTALVRDEIEALRTYHTGQLAAENPVDAAYLAEHLERQLAEVTAVLAAGLAAPVGETPDEPTCEHGETGPHAVIEMVGSPPPHPLCPGPALPVDELQR